MRSLVSRSGLLPFPRLNFFIPTLFYSSRHTQFSLKDGATYSNIHNHRHVVEEAPDFIFGKNKNLNVDGNTKLHNMVLRGWFRLGCWNKCWEFWQEMDGKGVHKDLHSYAIYMDMLCKSGNHWKAVKIYKEMKSKGMKLDVVVYNIVIRAIGCSMGVDFAVKVFWELKELGFKPTVVTYNTVIELLCDNHRYKEALVLLNMMPENGCQPNSFSYNCLFACLDKPKEILTLFDRMIESGVRPSKDTYVMLMRKFGRWGFLRPVFLVWKRMEQLGCRPEASTYDALIDALVEKGLVDMAMKYNEEMLAKGLSSKPRKELGTKLVVAESADE